MSNPIKYTAGTETLALKKGNFFFGTGDVGKGPTNVTGYYNGVDVPKPGYVVYQYKENVPGNLTYGAFNSDTELINFTNGIAGQTFTSVTQCFTYYAGQTDKVCFNRDYEPIITDGLVLNLDAGFDGSYPASGTTWRDLSVSGNNGTLINSPGFYDNGGGSIVFDGVDDYVNVGNIGDFRTASYTLESFVYPEFDSSQFGKNFFSKSTSCSCLGEPRLNSWPAALCACLVAATASASNESSSFFKATVSMAIPADSIFTRTWTSGISISDRRFCPPRSCNSFSK
jgi:hypothetical protein